MKTFISLLIIFLLSYEGSRAQTPIEVNEETLDFGNASMPAFTVTIPEANYDKSLKDWVKTLESGTRSKVVTENGKMTIFGAKIKSISDNPVNVYSEMSRQDSSVNLKAAFELEKDHYAGGTEYPNVRKYLVDFAKDQYLAVAEDQLNKEKKTLRELNKDVKSVKRNQSSLEKSVKSNNDLISSEQDKIASMNDELAKVSADVSKLQSGGMAGSELSNTGSSSLKDLEKEQKKLNKSIKMSEKKISQAEKKIDKDQREISNTSGDEANARNRLEEQQAVVNQYQAKRDAIKNFK